MKKARALMHGGATTYDEHVCAIERGYVAREQARSARGTHVGSKSQIVPSAKDATAARAAKVGSAR